MKSKVRGTRGGHGRAPRSWEERGRQRRGRFRAQEGGNMGAISVSWLNREKGTDRSVHHLESEMGGLA